MQQLLSLKSIFAKNSSYHTKNQISSNNNSNTLVSSDFSFNPRTVMLVTFIPLILLHFKLSIYYYIPITILFFSYLQNKKNKIDLSIALGIASNTDITKILQYLKSIEIGSDMSSTNHSTVSILPSWINDSDYQRCEWCNYISQKTWPWMAKYIESKVQTKWNEMDLSKFLPSVISYIKLERFSMGEIAPKIIGIRILDSNESNIIRMNLDIKYIGNPDIIIKIGTMPLPMTLEISDLRISASIRMELTNFIEKIPSPQVGCISFLQMPVIDFSFQIGGIDIMNIGTEQLNVAKSIKHIINNIIRNKILYPKKICVNPNTGQIVPEDDSVISHPQGILVLTIQVSYCYHLWRLLYIY